MAVHTVYGMTQSGKSYFVKKQMMPKQERTIVYDVAHCFDGGDYITLKNQNDVLKVFRKYSKKKRYKIILRPDRNDDYVFTCDLLISLACALGRACSPTYNADKRVWLVIDEADQVCSSHYQSKQLKHLVNKGRHDNVDSIFIARIPQRLHTDIRANSSRIVSFKISNATSIKEFVENFGRGYAKVIKELGKYERLEWDDTGSIAVYDSNNKSIKIGEV